MSSNPVDERRVETWLAIPVFLVSDRLQLDVGETSRFHPSQQPSQTGKHAVSRLVGPVVGVAPEEVVELGGPLGKTFLPVELRHGQLVLVGGENSAEDSIVTRSHPSSLEHFPRQIKTCRRELPTVTHDATHDIG